MVKAIVLYNSRTGSTEKVAKKIAEGLGAEYRSNKNIPDLKEYDLVATGSWVIMGMLSFAGKRYLRKLRRKNIAGKKVALFFTSGSPDDIHPLSMENILAKNKDVTILQDRFYCMGIVKMTKKGKVQANPDHPTEEDLAQAKAFGEQLKKQL
ncbi:MAG: flavodoxin family protein [Candidatus Heimdallarchaeota archaeon]